MLYTEHMQLDIWLLILADFTLLGSNSIFTSFVPQPNVDEALRQLRAAGIKAVGCAANVGNKADLKRLVDLAVDTYGSVDALVSNAAVNPSAGLILDMPDSAIDKILDVNVKSAILLVREVRPHLRKVGAWPD